MAPSRGNNARGSTQQTIHRPIATSLFSDGTRWHLARLATGIWLFISIALIGIGFSDAKEAQLAPIGVLATLTAALTLFRLRFLKPECDENTGRAKDYANWRKAMQKPLEAVIGLPLLILLAMTIKLASAAHAGADAKSDAIASFTVSLFAWTSLAGLVGSAGADSASLRTSATRNSGASQCATTAWIASTFGTLIAAIICGHHLPNSWWLAPWTICSTIIGLAVSSNFTFETPRRDFGDKLWTLSGVRSWWRKYWSWPVSLLAILGATYVSSLLWRFCIIWEVTSQILLAVITILLVFAFARHSDEPAPYAIKSLLNDLREGRRWLFVFMGDRFQFLADLIRPHRRGLFVFVTVFLLSMLIGWRVNGSPTP